MIFFSGGWWVGYKAWQGDWNSFRAHRLAHAWALADPAPQGWLGSIVQIIRSYYALFSASLFIGVPDLIVIAWLALPLSVLAVAAVIAQVGSPGQHDPIDVGRSSHLVVWVTFAGVFLCNAGAVLANLRFFLAPYGRLLFPSLVAIHTLAAAIVARMLRGRPLALAALTLVVISGAGLLFGWTFRQRLAPAIVQPPEDVRVLTDPGTIWSYGPVWGSPMEQPLLIPPGDLIALRIDIMRDNLAPQVGAALEGSLQLMTADGRRESVPVLHTALGDSDFALAWTEFELQRPVRLGAVTPALLALRGTPPVWPPGLTEFRYWCGDSGIRARSDGVVDTVRAPRRRGVSPLDRRPLLSPFQPRTAPNDRTSLTKSVAQKGAPSACRWV